MLYNWQGIYGALTFYLLHYRNEKEKAKSNALCASLSKVQTAMKLYGYDAPWGRAVDNLPEAKRVYLALCNRFDIKPEATS
jgi:N-acetyl-anhydromuramyl-L-alanine amidase AmpD